MKDSSYWKIRSEKYNNLEWVSDKSYIENVIECSKLSNSHVVLDAGSGMGVVANAIKNKVSSVVALDISNDMLSKGKWTGISYVEWDIREPLFDKWIFDRVIARMMFHHVMEDIGYAFDRCYECLKHKGKLIVAEAIPASNSDLVVKWFSEMFSHKEDRITFVPGQIETHMGEAGFDFVESFFFSMPNFSINNWLENSGLPQDKIDKIIKIHIDSPQEVKDVYDMRIDGNNILINSKYTIVVGEK